VDKSTFPEGAVALWQAMQLFCTIGQMDFSKVILAVSQVEAVGPGISGVVDPGVSPGLKGEGVFLSFWHAKITPSNKITRILFIFFG
jgi:hypothetical protein